MIEEKKEDVTTAMEAMRPAVAAVCVLRWWWFFFSRRCGACMACALPRLLLHRPFSSVCVLMGEWWVRGARNGMLGIGSCGMAGIWFD